MERARDYLKSHVSNETIEEVTNRGKYITQQESPTASLVQRRLYRMRGALRSMQRNVDIMREELHLPVQSDTLKMYRALRSMRRNVDIIREELRFSVQSLDPSIIRGALRLIQQDVDIIMREELRLPVQSLDPSIIREALRSMRRNVDIIREELAQYIHLTQPLDDDNTTS